MKYLLLCRIYVYTVRVYAGGWCFLSSDFFGAFAKRTTVAQEAIRSSVPRAQSSLSSIALSSHHPVSFGMSCGRSAHVGRPASNYSMLCFGLEGNATRSRCHERTATDRSQCPVLLEAQPSRETVTLCIVLSPRPWVCVASDTWGLALGWRGRPEVLVL